MFASVVEHIASDEEAAGHMSVAHELRRTLNQYSRNGLRARPDIAQAFSPDLRNMLEVGQPDVRLGDMTLSQAVAGDLRRVINEYRQKDLLQARGLEPQRKLLLFGPPGTGKGMTARALATELGLPLATILLDGLVTKFMGETASKLRQIFETMKKVPCVYFFDEIDAIAANRGRDDVGEARRILNSLLVMLENERSSSIIVAATNLRSMLDPAIFRRFHLAVSYVKPSPDEAERILRTELARYGVEATCNWQAAANSAADLSQADLVEAARTTARLAILSPDLPVTTETIIASLATRRQAVAIEAGA